MEEQERVRIIMKYRLFGWDGVTDKEFKKLIDYVQKQGPEEEREYIVRRKHDYDYQLSIMEAQDAARIQRLSIIERRKSRESQNDSTGKDKKLTDLPQKAATNLDNYIHVSSGTFDNVFDSYGEEDAKSRRSSNSSNDSSQTRNQKREQKLYYDNSEGDPTIVNDGFKVRPLDPEIFGWKRVNN